MGDSHHKHLDPKLLDLIEASLDGTLNDVGTDELTRLVENNPDALAVYVEFVNLHSALRWRCRTQSLEEVLEDDSLSQDLAQVSLKNDSKLGFRWSNYLSVLAVSVLLGFGLLAFYVIPRAVDAVSPGLNSIVESPLEDSDANRELMADAVERVAVLTRMVDVVWNDKTTRLGLKQSLPRQRIDIESGLLQIEFFCGAAVIIEGPASFELLDPDRGFAHSGRLRAYVPTRAQGFVIETSSGDVVDLGTEFGLDIAANGQSELHVLDGEVSFHSSSTDSPGPYRVLGGQSLRLDNESLDTGVIEADSKRFISPDELEARADIEGEKRYQRWLDYHSALHADPALVADYAFDDSHGWGRTLINAAPKSDESSYGAIVGASWQRGRWERSKALRFRSPSDRVRINLKGEFDSLSLATWVNIQKWVGDRSVALLHPEIEINRDPKLGKQRFIHWTLSRVPQGAVPHFAESVGHDKRFRNHYGPGSMGLFSEDVGHWVHLAVVYDRDDRLVSHYCNGELVGNAAIETPRKIGIGTGDLCNWPYKGWAAGTQFEYRNLVGMMDEFVVLSRALSADEVREMHEIGRP